MSKVVPSVKIPLHNRTGGIRAYALVSPEDVERVNKYKWHVRKGYKTSYAATSGYDKDGRTTIDLQCFIFGKVSPGKVVDHIDGNGLNDVRSNLHEATKQQNAQNKTIEDGKTIGISYHKKTQKWHAKSMHTNLGLYNTKEEACLAYDRYVLCVLGQYAKTNGTIFYEECKNLDPATLIKSKKERELPSNIIKYQKKYYAQISYNGKRYKSAYCDTVEEALGYLKIYQSEIDEIKKQEMDAHFSMPITKNSLGFAYIQVKDLQVLVDEDLWHKLMLFKWHLNADKYVINGVSRRMHHVVMEMRGVIISEEEIDHINRIRHDNRSINLRIPDDSINAQNRNKMEGTSSKYTGVSLTKTGNWEAYITKKYKRYSIGFFDNEEKAAVAYNIKAKELYGGQVKLNNVIDENLYGTVEAIMNNPKKHKGKSRFRGVTMRKDTGSWRATMQKDKQHYSLGTFKTEEEAALAFNKKAIELYGANYKYLNIIPSASN